MNSRIFWIASDKLNSLAIMARPRAGEWLEDEIANYKREGIDIVISLLEPHEAAELELQQEGKICEATGIIFMDSSLIRPMARVNAYKYASGDAWEE